MAGTAVVGSLIENLTSMVAQYLLEEASLVSSFRKDFDSLCDELESIKSLLKDAGGKRSSSSLCNWLEKLEDFLDDAVDIVEECRAAGSFCNPIFRYKMGGKIKKLNERIIQIHVSAKYIKYVGSVLDLNARVDGPQQRSNANKELPPMGMENNIQKIIDLLLKEDGPQVIVVVGMGGQGKTLLVQSVFKSQRVEKQFERLFWVVVSQKSNDKNVLKEIGIDSIAALDGKRCLFVLDDVWNIGHGLLEIIGSLVQRKHNIVITSRHRKVAESFEDAYIHMMSYLSEENNCKLFFNHAFPDHRLPEELKNMDCHPILEKCGGLSLAIKTIGA